MSTASGEPASVGGFQLFSGSRRKRQPVPAVEDGTKSLSEVVARRIVEETSDVARADPDGDQPDLPDLPEGGFKSLGLSDWLDRALGALGITAATPVQQSCIPPILKVAQPVEGFGPLLDFGADTYLS